MISPEPNDVFWFDACTYLIPWCCVEFWLPSSLQEEGRSSGPHRRLSNIQLQNPNGERQMTLIPIFPPNNLHRSDI